MHVARQAFDEAERELAAALVAQSPETHGRARFSSVALHWLLGLIHLARGDDLRARDAFDRELACEPAGHLYSRECCANTWYAVGALHLRTGQSTAAASAFAQALDRVASHRLAQLGLRASGGLTPLPSARTARADAGGQGREALSIETALVRAAELTMAGDPPRAARAVDVTLAGASPGSACWVLPVEPLLHVTAHPDAWATTLAHLRNRAL